MKVLSIIVLTMECLGHIIVLPEPRSKPVCPPRYRLRRNSYTRLSRATLKNKEIVCARFIKFKTDYPKRLSKKRH